MLRPTHTSTLEKTGSKDVAAVQKDRLQDSRHAPVAITERTNRALHRSEWVRGVNLPVLSGCRLGCSESQV